VLAAIFALVVFFAPTMGGYFLEHANFQPANPLQTPPHIHPVWYFTPFYAILRAVPNKLGGVIAMGSSLALLVALPWIDRNPVKSVRYRGPLFRLLILVFAATFIGLGYIGLQAATPLMANLALRMAELYFLFFAVLWIYSRQRSGSYYVGATVILLAVVSLVDMLRYDPDHAKLLFVSWLIPGIYLAIFLLLPAFTRLNESKPVPERVTFE
jgi:ubiquinol-cytochrome c reductase cytochrome b subunit